MTAGPGRIGGSSRGRVGESLRHYLVAGNIKAPYPVPVHERIVGPVVGVAARIRGVPTRAAALPDRRLAGRLHPLVELVLHLRTYVQPVEVVGGESLDGAER